MATRKQCEAALAKACPGATLIDESMSGYHYNVQLEAPKGHVWLQTGAHCRCLHWYDCGNKAEFWDYVLEDISMLDDAVKCNERHCHGVAEYGECEYWTEEEMEVNLT